MNTPGPAWTQTHSAVGCIEPDCAACAWLGAQIGVDFQSPICDNEYVRKMSFLLASTPPGEIRPTYCLYDSKAEAEKEKGILEGYGFECSISEHVNEPGPAHEVKGGK